MPGLSRLFVRAALCYLGTGALVGFLLLIDKAVGIAPWVWRLRQAHVEWLLLGFFAQLAMGVAHWILPRFRQPPVRGDGRPVVAAWICLNLGLVLVGLAAYWSAAAIDLLVAARGLEVIGAIAFASHAWPRIRPAGLEHGLRR